jgi:hypothetical protein
MATLMKKDTWHQIESIRKINENVIKTKVLFSFQFLNIYLGLGVGTLYILFNLGSQFWAYTW